MWMVLKRECCVMSLIRIHVVVVCVFFCLAKIVEDTAGNAFGVKFGDKSGTFFSKEMMSGLKAMIMGGRYIEGDKFNEVLLHQGMCKMAEFIRGKLLEQ